MLDAAAFNNSAFNVVDLRFIFLYTCTSASLSVRILPDGWLSSPRRVEAHLLSQHIDEAFIISLMLHQAIADIFQHWFASRQAG